MVSLLSSIRRLYTWTSPECQHRNQIDYIPCSQRWRSSIQLTKTRSGADCGSDHELLIPKFRLYLLAICKSSLVKCLFHATVYFSIGFFVSFFSLLSYMSFLVQWCRNLLLSRRQRRWGSIPVSGRSPGVGNGNPLQYSWLENSMDSGPWQATVHGVTKSWTQLSESTTIYFEY